MERNKSNRHNKWGIPMTLGVLMIIGGTLALSTTVLTSFVSILFIGGMLVAAGVLELVAAFRVRHGGPFWMLLLGGVLTSVVGGLFLFRPLLGIEALTLLVACDMFASGLFRGITSIADRYRGWGWDLGYAILAIALGAFVMISWPISSLWVIGTLVSVEIIARGFAMTAGSWVLRGFERDASVHAV